MASSTWRVLSLGTFCFCGSSVIIFIYIKRKHRILFGAQFVLYWGLYLILLQFLWSKHLTPITVLKQTMNLRKHLIRPTLYGYLPGTLCCIVIEVFSCPYHSCVLCQYRTHHYVTLQWSHSTTVICHCGGWEVYDAVHRHAEWVSITVGENGICYIWSSKLKIMPSN